MITAEWVIKKEKKEEKKYKKKKNVMAGAKKMCLPFFSSKEKIFLSL